MICDARSIHGHDAGRSCNTRQRNGASVTSPEPGSGPNREDPAASIHAWTGRQLFPDSRLDDREPRRRALALFCSRLTGLLLAAHRQA